MKPQELACSPQKRVVVIVNMPCSSGTFYTSFISQSLSSSPWIIDETSPNQPNDYGLKAFSLSVPLLKECIRGRVSFQEWRKIYKYQIAEIIKSWESSDSSLIVFRSHAWTDATSTSHTTISDTLKELSIDHDAIYTHRDPVDTWLGMNASFPESIEQISLTGFARIYKESIGRWPTDDSDRRTIHIKTEDIAKNQKAVIQWICNELGFTPVSQASVNISKEELGTGASGRFFENPVLPSRRPYSLKLRREIQKSAEFTNLQQLIGYKPGLRNENWVTHLASAGHLLYQPILRLKIKGEVSVGTIASKLKLRVAFY